MLMQNCGRKKWDVWKWRSSRVGAVISALVSHWCDLDSIPGSGVISGLSGLSLVLFSAPRGFSLETLLFSPDLKTTFPNNFQIDLERTATC